MKVDPKEFGLSPRIVLKQIDSKTIGIVKDIKSRIIQKDALKIVDIAQTLNKHLSDTKVVLCCNANICSKSLDMLSNNNINVVYL